MSARVATALALACFGMACSKEPPAAVTPPHHEPLAATAVAVAVTSAAAAPLEAPSAPPSVAPAAPSPTSSSAAPATSCEAIAARFEAARREGDASCTTPADCGCHSSLKLDGAIEVAGAKAASALQSIGDAYRAARCPTVCVQMAKPPVCKPACTAGQCR